MRLLAARWLVVGVVGLGAAYPVLHADTPVPLNSRQKAQAAIVKLSQHLDDADVTEQAAKIIKEHDSCDISSVFRLRRHGGLGIGKAAEAANLDSIERLVIELSTKKTTTEAQLEKFQDDYVRVAKVLQAMAELAPHRGPDFTRNDPVRIKKWAAVSADFKEHTADFRKALEEKDPKKVRITADRLYQTCMNCHDVRDS
jgi:hypothetical protein